MKKIMGTKKLLFVLMAILIPLGTLQITDAKAYWFIAGWKDFAVQTHDADADVSYYESVRIWPNEEFNFILCQGQEYDSEDITKVDDFKITKVESSSEKLSVRYEKDEYSENRWDVYVKASEEGTYTIKFTAEITHYRSRKKRTTYIGTTTVYVYDFPHNLSYQGYSHYTYTIDELLYDTKFYMNGKRIKSTNSRRNFALRSNIPKGRLTAKLDKSWKGISITKIKVYGTADRGGKKTTIKNAKKGKKVYLNRRKKLKTGVRVFYKDKYTGVTRTEFFTIEYKK